MSGLKIATVWNAIVGLNVAGLTILDIDQVTEEWKIRQPTLFPDITSPLDLQVPTRQSFGTIANGAKKDSHYTLNYILLYAAVGTGRGVKDAINGMFEMLALIYEALTETDSLTGAVEITPRIASPGVVVTDVNEASFWGLRLAFDVTEFYEV